MSKMMTKNQKDKTLRRYSASSASKNFLRKNTSYKSRSGNSLKKADFKINFEDFKAPTYEEIISEIRSKIGSMPPIPRDLPKGVWSKQANKVLQERYLRKDEDGNIIETPEEMCWRVAWEVASAEARWGKDRKEVTQIAREFYTLLVTHEFLPNSPTLMNAGTGNGLQYSACFVIPVEDSMEGVFDALKYQAMIHKTGGGTGFSFSRLRPRGARVRTSAGTASGPVSFMRIFDAATNEVKQGGKRRGANMGILRVDHPDILEFIHCKEDGSITNFNISVAVTDSFMQAYEKDSDYDLVDPRDGRKVGSLSARKVFEEIAEAAWRTGDPGLIFIDRINKSRANPVPTLGPIESTNPCGEQPLYPYDACNLGSIFLNYFVKKDRKADVDWERLIKTVRLSVRFLDDVIEVNPYPLEQIRKMVFAIRRIGLGIGGWADMLSELGIAYDSDEALVLGEKVMKVIEEEAVKQTKELARERGPFPMFGLSIYKDEEPRRNSTVTTIAPTGSISIIANASSGIEPLFAIAFQHIVKDKHLDRTLTFFNPIFEKKMKELGLWTQEMKEKVAKEGKVRHIKEIPEELRRVFGTAHEIHHDWHIKHQAVFQKYTENAVSKTINMANSVSVEEVKEAYLLAWKMNCNGVTIYRDGSKSTQVLNLGVKEEKKEISKNVDPLVDRPFVVKGATYKLETPLGKAFITINENERHEPFEVFINIGKAGSDVAAMAHALAITISAALRFRGGLAPLERAREIVSKLSGIGGRRSVGFGSNKILSLPDAVAYALALHFGFTDRFENSLFANDQKTGIDSMHVNPQNQSKVMDSNHGNSASADRLEEASDGAGAVMSAQFPAEAGPDQVSGDDPTTASVTSDAFPSGGNGPLIAKSSPSNNQLSLEEVVLNAKIGDICPSCGLGTFVYQEGCVKCFSCGYSEC